MSPSAEEVRRQLDRLLASPGFVNAGRMSRFLKFVVEKTLAGEGERLKEYVIGVEVFDRGTDYDPRVDAIVRVEAARLRAKLVEYYAGAGRGDAVILSLPKGGYSPAIKLEAPPVANGAAAMASLPPQSAMPAAARRRPRLSAWLGAAALIGLVTIAAVAYGPALTPPPESRVAVLPFAVDAHTPRDAALASRLTEGVTAELVRMRRFVVIASAAARAASATALRPRDVAATLEADVLIEARVTTDGEQVRVEARAASGALEEKFWVGDFAGTVANSDVLERELATAIAHALASAKTVNAR